MDERVRMRRGMVVSTSKTAAASSSGSGSGSCSSACSGSGINVLRGGGKWRQWRQG